MRYFAMGFNKQNFTVKLGDGSVGEVELCRHYARTKRSIEVSNAALKYMIIGINVVLKLVVVKIIDAVGCDTQSSEMSFVMMAVFITTLFNTGFLLLIVNGNLEEQKSIPFHRLMTGDISDFNQQWFENMGTVIIGSMQLNIVMPIILETSAACIRGAKRLLDYVKRGKDTTTSTKTIQAYINLYAGPEYFLHAKYSSILTITYIAMIYGTGMPVLFVIAA